MMRNSAALLRVARPAAAAAIPFVLLWALAFATALYKVHVYSGTDRCDVTFRCVMSPRRTTTVRGLR